MTKSITLSILEPGWNLIILGKCGEPTLYLTSLSIGNLKTVSSITSNELKPVMYNVEPKAEMTL